jgi:hypothetical protein
MEWNRRQSRKIKPALDGDDVLQRFLLLLQREPGPLPQPFSGLLGDAAHPLAAPVLVPLVPRGAAAPEAGRKHRSDTRNTPI